MTYKLKLNQSIIILLLFGFCLSFISCGEDPIVNPPPSNENVRLSISSVTQFEGDENSVFSFQVATSVAGSSEIRVDFTTEGGTAESDVDFESKSGTLTFAAGERSKNIDITILTDTIKEADELFKVILSNPIGATITQAEGSATIRNDDDFVFVPEDGYITPESYAGYDLVWQDEFNGTSINSANWTHEIGAGGWGNQESQYYTDSPSNSFIQDGKLIIEARKEDFNGAPYTSARMVTLNKKEFRFSRVDIRAILPEGQGIWPALWMLGTNIQDIGWPACGEIDIMELVGHEPSKIHGTAHWGPQGQTFSNNHGDSISLNGEKFSDRYHVFTIIREFNKIRWYMDDTLYFTLNDSDVSITYPFNDEFFFIFNIAVGGEWPGYPDASTVFPQRMIVDYVRVFEEN